MRLQVPLHSSQYSSRPPYDRGDRPIWVLTGADSRCRMTVAPSRQLVQSYHDQERMKTTQEEQPLILAASQPLLRSYSIHLVANLTLLIHLVTNLTLLIHLVANLTLLIQAMANLISAGGVFFGRKLEKSQALAHGKKWSNLVGPQFDEEAGTDTEHQRLDFSCEGTRKTPFNRCYRCALPLCSISY
ncbi:MAG: hypothetical protein J3Q66DRAFT_367243 [Benniella sp.]|nr:MAG: hypothetical protein J3Q66DRAFT_367243 [Benniella sp.]